MAKKVKPRSNGIGTIIPKQPGSQYTNEQRRAVIADFVVTGNITKTAALHNMPEQTVRDWTNSDWGVELCGEIREQKAPELDAHMTKLIDSAFDQAQDRIENGDFRLLKVKKAIQHDDGSVEISEDYELKRVPMGGKELIVGGAVVYDKQRLHRNQPTQIRAETADAQIQSFISEYRKIAQSYKIVSTQENSEVAE